MGKKFEAPPEHPGTRKLLGVFNAFTGLAIGDPYSDRRIVDPRHKGKGLVVGHWRSDRCKDCRNALLSQACFLAIANPAGGIARRAGMHIFSAAKSTF
jgi:hypothetical protein